MIVCVICVYLMFMDTCMCICVIPYRRLVITQNKANDKYFICKYCIQCLLVLSFLASLLCFLLTKRTFCVGLSGPDICHSFLIDCLFGLNPRTSGVLAISNLDIDPYIHM